MHIIIKLKKKHKKLVFFSGKPILIGGIYILVLILISFPKDFLLICSLGLNVGFLIGLLFL